MSYYQSWKLLSIFVETEMFIYVLCIIWWIENSKEQHFPKTEIFCNIINVFTVTFNQFSVYLNKHK